MAKATLPASWKNLWPMPAPVLLVSCVGKERPPNIITIAAGGIASGNPLLISLAIGVRQYSLELIKETEDFVVNVPSVDQVHMADWCGSHSGRKVDKFAEMALTPGDSDRVTSPYVVECPVNYECTLWKSVDCGSHELVLGEIVQVHVDEDRVNTAGDALDPQMFNPLMSLQIEYFGRGHHVGPWGLSRKR